jgi:hypothetical protein
MYAKAHIEDRIISTFRHKDVFKREELWTFVRGLDPDMKEARLNYIILGLKKKGKLHDVGKGVYAIGSKEEFRPEPDEMIRKLAEFIHRKAGLEDAYDIWSTDWLNEFLELQATSSMYILEVDKLDMERVFFSLRDQGNYNFVFSNPDRTVIETYISGLPEAIIVWPLIKRAPVETRGQVTFPTLEKIMVDLFCDTELYFAYQGAQLIHIFETVSSKYLINFSRLLNYAKRRNREQALQAFLLKHTNTQTEINSTKK